MNPATGELLDFVRSAVMGISDSPIDVVVEAIESVPRTTTLVIRVNTEDQKYVQAKMKEIRTIAIAIACKHKSTVRLILEEE